MAYIILPDKWKRQPDYPTELDANHWLVQKGIALYMPLTGVRPGLVYGAWRNANTDAVARNPDGMLPGGQHGLVADLSAQYIEFTEAVATWPLTMLVWGKVAASSSQPALSIGRSGGGGSDRLVLQHNEDGTITALSATSSSNSTSVTTDTYAANEWFFSAARFNSNAHRQAGLNGIYATAQTTTRASTGLNRTLIGSRILSGSYSTYTGKLFNAMIVKAGLTADEFAQIYYEQKQNPYEILRKSARILYFNIPSGSTTGTLAATESGADTLAIAGDVLVQGALSASESGADTMAIAGDVLVEGALAATESGADVCAIAGEGAALETTGTLAASESGSDTAALAGKVYIAGTLSATEGALDAFAVSGNILVQGALDATESGADSAAFTAPASDSAKLDLILDILQNKQVLDPVTGLFTLYADDGVTVLYTAPAWEDAAGTIPYSGGCVRRIDAMS